MRWIPLAVIVSNLVFSRADYKDVGNTNYSLNITSVSGVSEIPQLLDPNNVLAGRRRRREAPVRPFSNEETQANGPAFDYKTNSLNINPSVESIYNPKANLPSVQESENNFGGYIYSGQRPPMGAGLEMETIDQIGSRIGPAGSAGGPVMSGRGAVGGGIGNRKRHRDNLKSRCHKNNQAAVCQNKRKELARRRFGEPLE